MLARCTSGQCLSSRSLSFEWIFIECRGANMPLGVSRELKRACVTIAIFQMVTGGPWVRRHEGLERTAIITGSLTQGHTAQPRARCGPVHLHGVGARLATRPGRCDFGTKGGGRHVSMMPRHPRMRAMRHRNARPRLPVQNRQAWWLRHRMQILFADKTMHTHRLNHALRAPTSATLALAIAWLPPSPPLQQR